MKCSLCIFRELVPVRCQNLFGKLELQSTGGLTGEEKILITFREDSIFWQIAYLKEIQNFLLEMLWFRSSCFTKVVLRVHSLCLSPSLLDQVGGQDADHNESSQITLWFLLAQGTCFPLAAPRMLRLSHHMLNTCLTTQAGTCARHLHWADGNHSCASCHGCCVSGYRDVYKLWNLTLVSPECFLYWKSMQSRVCHHCRQKVRDILEEYQKQNAQQDQGSDFLSLLGTGECTLNPIFSSGFPTRRTFWCKGKSGEGHRVGEGSRARVL